MVSSQAEAFRDELRRFYQAFADSGAQTPGDMRKAGEGYSALTGEVSGVTWTAAPVGDLTAQWSEAGGSDRDRTVLFLHGGGYLLGSSGGYANFAGHLSAVTGCRVLAVDYPLAPEAQHPGPVNAVTAAYQWLIGQGQDPGRLVLAGNSAGAGLALAALLSLKATDATLPAAVIAMSPMADMLFRGASHQANRDTDISLGGDGSAMLAQLYVGDGDPGDPLASPVYGDFSATCPVYVSAGGDEVFLDDSVAVADAVRRGGNDVVLDVTAGLQHDFQIGAGRFPEADQLLARLGAWTRAKLGLT
jgi:epsilon-lactone hydrolase